MKKLAALLLCLVLTGGALSCAALAEQAWQCPACGREGLAGKFCPNCGAARPSTDWVCPNCGSNNQGKFCPDCGTARDAQPTANAAAQPTADAAVQAVGQMTVEQLMIPLPVIELMNRCIAATCEGIAADYSMDADELYAACELALSEVGQEVIYFDNPDWSIELYFYFKGVNEPDVNMEATHWCIAVGDKSSDPELMRSVAFSAAISLLCALDPEFDADAALEFLSSGDTGDRYEGNGYQCTYLVTGNGTETQLMVQRI